MAFREMDTKNFRALLDRGQVYEEDFIKASFAQ